jgi:hypothetical protein
MTIMQRMATTIYDRSNRTIIDVLEIDEPVPVAYTPQNYFEIFNAALNSTTRDSINGQFIFHIASFVSNSEAGIRDPYRSGQFLRQLMSVPVAVYHNIGINKDWGLPDNNLNRPGAVAELQYRVDSLNIGLIVS